MSSLLLFLAVLVLSIALRSFGSKILRKIGALGYLAATFLALYLPTGSIAAGVGGLSIWFLLPWVELIFRVRKLRLPVAKRLESQSPPGRARFPELRELSDEIEDAGFEHAADTGWDWDGLRQFYRLYYRAESREQAAICFTEQEGVSWGFLSVSVREADGEIHRTTNLPISSPMPLPPDVHLYRETDAESFAQLLELHRSRCEKLGLTAGNLLKEDPEDLPGQIERETGRQIQHNLDRGIIRLADETGTFRYSWRGLFYLYFQLVKDMVRMC